MVESEPGYGSDESTLGLYQVGELACNERFIERVETTWKDAILTTAGHTVKAQLFVTVNVRALTANAAERDKSAAEAPFFML